jgi:hypothetical protein
MEEMMAREAAVQKAPEIRRLVSRVMQSSLGQHLTMVNHWDADLFAVGFANRKDSSRLVYVTAWRQEPGTFSFECEYRPSGSDVPTIEQSGTVAEEALIRVIREYLKARHAVQDQDSREEHLGTN